MTDSPDVLTWSAQYHVAPSDRTARLQGDKITLPPSALEALLAAAPIAPVDGGSSQSYAPSLEQFTSSTLAGQIAKLPQPGGRQQQLPHPLTFRLVNPQNGRVVYAGIREFSAQEDEIGLSRVLQDALGLGDGSSAAPQDQKLNGGAETNGVNSPKSQLITIHASHLPKGTYVRLRPLEAGYDPEDWKSLLERHLRDNFTTLTNGELLSVASGRHERFQFLIDKLEPSGEGICIVDTDLEVVIEALNEEQARETLSRKLAKGQRVPDTAEGSSAGGTLAIGEEQAGQVMIGDYVDYEVKTWPKRGQGICFDLEISQDDAELDLFFSPFSSRQRARPRNDEHVLGDFSSRSSKRIRLSGTNDELINAEALRISVHAYQASVNQKTPSRSIPFVLRADAAAPEISNAEAVHPATDEVICKNCHQPVPARTLPLHEAFCYRNNISCPGCKQVFLKGSKTWNAHWHCQQDSSYGNTALAHGKHDTIYHPSTPYICPDCNLQACSLAVLATHRTSTCPGKEILCQFCHLAAPQQGPDDPPFTDAAVIISGLTPHEFTDGARTTDCHLCNKPVRLRDMKTHLDIHDRDRLLRPPPRVCRNGLCGNMVNESADSNSINNRHQLGLCTGCFTPLYASVHDDASGKLLRRRVERRLLHQLMAGCGRRWCRNTDFCRTAVEGGDGIKTDSGAGGRSIKQLLPLITPILDELNSTDAPLHLCVDDESSQRRRLIAQAMEDREAEYRVEWWVRGLWETRAVKAAVEDADAVGYVDDERSIDRARDWLRDRAPRIGEVLG